MPVTAHDSRLCRILLRRVHWCRKNRTTTWAYDANGNRTTENGQTIATYDNQDRLLKWRNNTYQYNAAGDLSQKTTPAGTNRYSYDAQGNLRSVTLANGKTISYAIDPANRRTGKTINGQLQWQLVWLDGLKPLARLKADNTLDQIYYYADKANVPGAMSKDGKNYRIISDQNGSVRLVIDATTGEVAQQMEYDTWGNVTQDTNPGFQPFGFAGGLYDPDTGLTRFGARDYDAETGRWTAKDPILFAGGDSNLYGYVLQDPVNHMDPLGLATDCEINTAIDLLFTAYPRLYKIKPNSVKGDPVAQQWTSFGGVFDRPFLGQTDMFNNILYNESVYGAQGKSIPSNTAIDQQSNFLQTMAHELLHVQTERLARPFISEDFIDGMADKVAGPLYSKYKKLIQNCTCGGN